MSVLNALAPRAKIRLNTFPLFTPDPVILDDIYALFQRSQEEADRRFAEADHRAAEADRRTTESKAEFDRAMTQSRVEFDRAMAQSRAEFDHRAAEAEQRLVRAEAIAAQANQAVNNLSGRWGRFVENIVAPAVLRLFQE